MVDENHAKYFELPGSSLPGWWLSQCSEWEYQTIEQFRPFGHLIKVMVTDSMTSPMIDPRTDFNTNSMKNPLIKTITVIVTKKGIQNCGASFALLWCFWNLKLISHGRSQYWLLGFWVHGLHWEMLSEYLCIGKRTFFGLSMRMPMYMVAPFNNNKHTSRFKIRRQRQFEMLRLSKLVPDYQS